VFNPKKSGAGGSSLKARLFQRLTPPLPNAWEIEEYLETIQALSPLRQELVLNHVPAIWPVSNALCYSYLNSVAGALQCLADQQLTDWVAAILEIYERQGLREAQLFMADVSGNYLCRLRGETGVELAGLPHLQTYAQGMAGQPVRLAPSPEIWTDTETIYLPARVARFSRPEDNFLFYKLVLTLQVGMIRSASCHLTFQRESPLIRDILANRPAGPLPRETVRLDDFFQLFPIPRLAEDLFNLAETWRLMGWLSETCPGLRRDTARLRREMAESLGDRSCLPGLGAVIAGLGLLILTDGNSVGLDQTAREQQAITTLFLQPAEGPAASASKTAAILDLLAQTPAVYERPPELFWLGRINPEAAWQVRMRNRMTTRESFVKALAQLLAQSTSPEMAETAKIEGTKPTKPNQTATAALVMAPGIKDEEAEEQAASPLLQTLLTLDLPPRELPDSLKQLVAEINRDLGGIPTEYVSAAQGLAGQGAPPVVASATSGGESLNGPLTYDEWDFRRHGFRRQWCQVNEKALEPVQSTLVARTLRKYQGQLRRLRRQFEMLRTQERFLRRQPDGNDLDLDAVIESLSDRRAGLPGSDQLFMRLRRDQRDIAALFLVDMSSSTEGWVNLALQEALIMTGEALQTIGDRFAIVGFSGMRRSRTDIYRVKDFGEPYGNEVKARIAAIAPKEYTRMGPAVRHASQLLQGIEAKVRLLIVLSDGKPEDYDDYKGNYAIEDTRHALIEAKAAGIHPFCITIDRQAHAYMPHMYGEVNYIFLDDVGKLPQRMPAIYRNLTT
jgi:nitric oxide reductase NorD protein